MARRIVTAREQHEMLSPWRTASGFDPFKVTHRLRDEFHDWFGQQYQQDPTRYSDKQWGAGLSHWPVIEDFLKDKYPAAHRGLMTGREDASALLDYPEASGIMSRYDDETGFDIKPYSSDDHQKLGYDPAEVAAGMVLLHNQNRDGLSNGYLDEDKDRLVDIFNKRQQMQRQYEQRTGATYWHLTDNPDFRPDPTHSPELNTTMGGDMKPGLFLTRDPSHWMQGYGYWRPYVSEIEAPDDVGLGSHLSPERYVPADQYHQLQVKRTIPIDAYSREHYNEPGWVEDDSGHDFQSGLPLEPAPGGYHKRNWDGKYQYPGTAMDQPEEWRKSYEQRVRDYQRRTPGIIAGRY